MLSRSQKIYRSPAMGALLVGASLVASGALFVSCTIMSAGVDCDAVADVLYVTGDYTASMNDCLGAEDGYIVDHILDSREVNLKK